MSNSNFYAPRGGFSIIETATRMADKVSAKIRSRNMAQIRSKGNQSTELRLAKALRSGGVVGWRRQLPLPGKPDFVFKNQRLAIFVHGCFWHGCKHCYREPTSNVAYWTAKLLRNMRRDRQNARRLRNKGYRVLTIWECELKNKGSVTCVSKIVRALRSRPQSSGRAR